MCYLHINRYIHIHASINYILQSSLSSSSLSLANTSDYLH